MISWTASWMTGTYLWSSWLTCRRLESLLLKFLGITVSLVSSRRKEVGGWVRRGRGASRTTLVRLKKRSLHTAGGLQRLRILLLQRKELQSCSRSSVLTTKAHVLETAGVRSLMDPRTTVRLEFLQRTQIREVRCWSLLHHLAVRRVTTLRRFPLVKSRNDGRLQQSHVTRRPRMRVNAVHGVKRKRGRDLRSCFATFTETSSFSP